MTDEEKVAIIKETIEDWRKNELSSNAAMFAVAIIISQGEKPHQKDIEWAKQVYPRLAEILENFTKSST